MEKNMGRSGPLWFFWGCAFVVIIVVDVGCKTADSKENTIAALEREVARLKVEKANLDARSSALDDKVLVLEKRLEKCTPSDGPSLKVVRLTRDNADELEEKWSGGASMVDDMSQTSRDRTRSDRGKRPLLVLSNRSSASRHTRPVSPTKANPRVSNGDFSHLGADNLGVVDSAEETSAPGEMRIFNDAYRAYANKTYDVALTGFAKFVSANPAHSYADNALYWRGECYLAIGKLPKAIGEFERLARRYPKSEKAAAAVYRLGYVYDKLRDYGKAADFYFEVVERYPGTDEARRASRRVAEIKNRSGNVSGLIPTSATR